MPSLPTWTKPAVWGGVVGAIAITIIGFSANWVTTAGAAEQMAQERSEEAVVAALTPVCVAQFRAQDQEAETADLAALEQTHTYSRDDFVADNGWATLPGMEEANADVAERCAEQLLEAAET